MTLAEKITELKSSLPADITLVAVSKTKPIEMILEAYETGQRDFGENYVQELLGKYEKLPKDIRWHYIGHLQSNKVKNIASFIYLIHGVDSLKLLEEINKQALNKGRVINCLLQIYIATEETKFGLSFKECENLMRSEIFAKLKNIKVMGFMGMASNTGNEEQVRKEFRSLKQFRDSLANRDSLLTLSYGMSSDYKIAIEEGSNMVRIGSSLFGERSYES